MIPGPENWQDRRGRKATSQTPYNIKKRAAWAEDRKFELEHGLISFKQISLCHCGRCSECKKRESARNWYRRKVMKKRSRETSA